jgi:hypothetical protein
MFVWCERKWEVMKSQYGDGGEEPRYDSNAEGHGRKMGQHYVGEKDKAAT